MHLAHRLTRIALAVAALPLAAACAAPSSDATSDDVASDEQFATSGIREGSAEAAAVLRVANTLSAAELQAKAGLPARVAEAIAAARLGEERFDTLAELDAVPHVGPAMLRRMLAHAKANGYVELRANPWFESAQEITLTCTRELVWHANTCDGRREENRTFTARAKIQLSEDRSSLTFAQQGGSTETISAPFGEIRLDAGGSGKRERSDATVSESVAIEVSGDTARIATSHSWYPAPNWCGARPTRRERCTGELRAP